MVANHNKAKNISMPKRNQKSLLQQSFHMDKMIKKLNMYEQNETKLCMQGSLFWCGFECSDTHRNLTSVGLQVYFCGQFLPQKVLWQSI